MTKYFDKSTGNENPCGINGIDIRKKDNKDQKLYIYTSKNMTNYLINHYQKYQIEQFSTYFPLIFGFQ